MNKMIKITGLFMAMTMFVFFTGCEEEQKIQDKDTYTFALMGSSEVTLNVYSTYYESGVVAVDSDGNSLQYNTNCEVDTNTIGTYTCVYILSEHEDRLERTVHVVDTESPVMYTSNIYVQFGIDGIDFEEYEFEYSDNYDSEVSMTIVSDDINYSVSGDYSVVVILSDSSGNEQEYTITITVLDTVLDLDFATLVVSSDVLAIFNLTVDNVTVVSDEMKDIFLAWEELENNNADIDVVQVFEVETIAGERFVMVYQQTNGMINLVSATQMFDDPVDCIKDFTQYGSNLVEAVGPLTISELLEVPYYATTYSDFTTLQALADDLQINVNYMEAWETNWGQWTDVVVIVHIGDYYIGWMWL